MITNVRDFVDLLTKLRISPNQFLICMLVHDKDVVYTIKYYEENERHRFNRNDIDDLVSRDILLRLSTDRNNYQLDYFAVTPKFTNCFLVDNDDAGDELWNTFPDWLKMNGTRVSAKSCDKDELVAKYAKKIKGSLKKHREVLDIVKEYSRRNNEYSTMGIQKFVDSEQWTILKKEYAENPDSGDLTINM